MTDDKMICTEEYILNEEKDRANWGKNYASKIDKAISLANYAIGHKGHIEIKALEDYFQNEEMVMALSEVSDIAFIMVLLDIYNAEKLSGVENTVFYWGNNLEEVISVIRQVKFFLWEIEFLNDSQSGQLLLKYIKEAGISMPAFEYIVFISSYDKNKIVKHLEKLFIN